MKKIFLFFLLFSACFSNAYRYELAICAIFKNEAPWLKEWLDYHHHILKVERFYLYNNESSDDYLKILQPYIDQGIVELIDWDSSTPSHLVTGPFMDAPWSKAQLGAYHDCLKNKALGQAKWVAMIDIDEFIVPVEGIKSFYNLLKKAEKNHKGTVSLFWKVFGTSDVYELNPKENLTEKLTWRSHDEHPWNQHVKSIHRPEAIDFCLVHIAKTLKPHFGSRTLSANQARIHHYWTRTERFCSEKRKISKEKDPSFFEALHQIEDRTILQYYPFSH